MSTRTDDLTRRDLEARLATYETALASIEGICPRKLDIDNTADKNSHRVLTARGTACNALVDTRRTN